MKNKGIHEISISLLTTTLSNIVPSLDLSSSTLYPKEVKSHLT